MLPPLRLLSPLLLIAAALFAVGIATADRVRWMFFNSDILLPIAYSHDLLHHPHAVFWFQLPHIPSFFPDMMLIVLLSALIASWQVVSLCYAAVSFTALVLMCSLIVVKLTGRNLLPSITMFLALTMIAMLLDLQFNDARGAYFYILFPVIHSGSFVAALGGALLVRQLVDKPRAGLAVGIIVLTAICTLSDRIFIGVFALPAVAGTLTFLVPMRPDSSGTIGIRRFLLVLTVVATGCVGGIVTDHLLFGYLLHRDPDFSIDVAAQLVRLHALIRDPSVHFEAACAGIVFLLPVIGGLRSLEARFWWAVAATMIAGTLALLPLIYVDSSATRYAQPIWWWTLVVLATAVLRVAPRLAPLYTIGAAVMLALATTYVRTDLLKPALVTQWHDPLERCLMALHDRGAIHAGIGQYWIARPLEASSDWKLQVVQVTDKGWMMGWQNNMSYYGRSPDDPDHPPNFDFLITTRLDMAVVGARFGTPARIIGCAGNAIWIYDDMHRFRRSIVGVDSWARHDGLLDTPAWFSPGDLLARNGPLPPDGTVPATATADPSIATWGPYIALLPGRWRLALRYQLDGNAAKRDRWDILLGNAAPLAATGMLEAGKIQEKSITFDIPKGRGVMEFRTSIAAGDRLQLSGFTLCLAGTPEALCRPEFARQEVPVRQR